MKRMVESAIVRAVAAHEGVTRKGKTRPYIFHPLEAMLIASEITEDENVLSAAALHDTVEDAGVTLEELKILFGDEVSELVASVSEDKMTDRSAESTWEIRKQRTLDELEGASRETKIICLGDKLSNLREIARDYEIIGDGIWERFNQKDKKKHGWYYGGILKILKREFGDVRPIREYEDLLKRVFG